jgi:glycosyltransferase involved in cell wall biosynthesis
MRIIVVNDHGSITGGAAQVAIASLNELANRSFDVTFVSASAPVDNRIDQDKVRVINYGVHELISSPSKIDAAIHGIWDARCAKKIGILLDEHDPQETVVHLHTWVKSLTSSVIHKILSSGFKLIVTLHDYFAVCPNGGLFNYQKQTHCEITPMSMSCLLTNCDARSYAQKLWRYGRHVVQRQVAGMPSSVENFISISDYSERILRPYLPTTAKIYRVRNPIEIDFQMPASPSNNDLFSFVGRLSPEKGGELFARAARSANVPAAFIGTGAEAQAISEVYPDAQMHGWQNRLGVISAISSSRALVFPSLWHETQGLVVLEAAALGIPSIVSDGCAAADYVIHGESGMHFKSGDVEDLAKGLKILENDKELVKHMGQNAYKNYWNNPCTLENHILDLLQCYSKIMRN